MIIVSERDEFKKLSNDKNILFVQKENCRFIFKYYSSNKRFDWNEMKSGYKKGKRKFQSFEWVTITTNQSQCASTRMSTRHIPCLFPVKFIFPHNFHAQRPVSLKLYMKKWQRNANRTRNQTGEEKKIFSYGSLKAFSHQRLNRFWYIWTDKWSYFFHIYPKL